MYIWLSAMKGPSVEELAKYAADDFYGRYYLDVVNADLQRRGQPPLQFLPWESLETFGEPEDDEEVER